MLRDTASPVPEAAMEATRVAGLVYASDAQPGIRRLRAAKGFRYVIEAPGSDRPRALRDSGHLLRIRSLAIPPAWEDVWISPDEDSHIQATGRDLRGRKQYRYHPRWTACRDDVKFLGLVAFAEQLPRLRRRVARGMKLQDLSRECVIASVVWLLDRAMIRVGNEAYARDNKSFGLTTLRNRHVKVRGATLRFAFRGKSGKNWNLEISDRRVARVVKSVQDLPGQQLFQYFDATGETRTVTSQDVNEYVRNTMGEGFTSKHFRTWGGSVAAAELFCALELPDTKAARKQAMNAIIDKVAALLGNTRAVCRKCYIHPLVMHDWADGRLTKDMEAAKKSARSKSGLQSSEALFVAWLKKAQRRKS